MSFQPYPVRSGFLSLGVTIALGVAAIYLFITLFQQNSPPQIFQALIGFLALLSLTGLAAHWTIVAFNLRYHLNRNGLAIQWGMGQHIIPFNSIKNIVLGQEISTEATFKGINIAGLRFGRGELAGYGLLKFRTSAPLANSLLVVTSSQSYVISPQQPTIFIDAWHARQKLGPTQQWTEDIRHSRPFNNPLFTDSLAWALSGGAALLLLALLGYISLNYFKLPQALPIHFDSLGRADRIAPKIVLFTLPAAGAIVWSINFILGSLIYRREKVGTYLLWGSTIVVQFGLWVALLTSIA